MFVTHVSRQDFDDRVDVLCGYLEDDWDGYILGPPKRTTDWRRWRWRCTKSEIDTMRMSFGDDEALDRIWSWQSHRQDGYVGDGGKPLMRCEKMKPCAEGYEARRYGDEETRNWNRCES